MTIREAIDRIDSLKHNTYSYAEKVLWLSKLDYVIKRQIINTHEGWDKVKFSGYTAKTKDTTKLLVPAPYDEMYIHWLAAQIDYANGEYDRYNNTMAMYQTEYNGYSNYYNRNHMPLGYTLSYSGSEAAGSNYPDEEPEEEDPGDNDPDNGGGSYNYAKKEWVEQNFQPKGEYLTEVPDDYAKTSEIPQKPEDIGAQPVGNYALVSQIPSVPVKSVNGKTGAVQLSAADVGARPSNWMPTAQDVGALPSTYTPPNQTAAQVGADPKGTASAAVAGHNTSTDAHGDIRQELQALTARLNAFFDSDDQTLDELSEIVAYITSNKGLIDAITTSKVSVIDIVNNLTTNVANKPLSAAQGVVLKGLIDTLTSNLSNYALMSAIPTKVSQLQNDSKYLTQHQDISHLLPRTELPTAIDTALAQAKASGEFDGYSPQIGVDYWTAADQEAIVQQVIAALGTPVFGTVGTDKKITLSTDNLVDGTYELGYEDKNGNWVKICDYIKGGADDHIIPVQFYAGKIDYDNGGEIVQANNYCYSDLIPIESGKQYYLAVENEGATFGNYRMVYYDADGNYLDKTDYVTGVGGNNTLATMEPTVLPMSSNAAGFRLRIALNYYQVDGVDSWYLPSLQYMNKNAVLTWSEV